MNEILNVIYRRRSIRKFTKDKVDQSSLQELLKVGMAAPSARNGQPWEFVVITDEKIFNKIRDRFKGNKFNAPAAIVVCANINLSDTKASEGSWIQDCSAATENILIAATSLGLGTVWTASYPHKDRMAVVRDVLKIPESVIPLCMIYVGYPANEIKPRTQYKEERVHWERYRS